MDYEAKMFKPLEEMLLDTDKEPIDLPLSLLKAITNNFCEDQKIGSGGFAVVYKGFLQNGSVAVKRLSQEVHINEESFNKEVRNLINLKHKNIVRFIGYCSDTQEKACTFDGNIVMAAVQQRLLCFEFMQNGGLDKHIHDASIALDWKTCYQIIKGICEGLHYLHEHNILHLDLKPANILLDCNMVPKIADFGLSRCFDGKQTRAITEKVVGTLGYMAPELINGGLITYKSDIYSLGIIITEILTGKREYFQIENELESWSSRFQTSHGGTWSEHIRECAEIGLKCMDFNPARRPTIEQILGPINQLESTYGVIEANLSAMHVQPLEVYPLEVCFPWEANECIEWPVTLTNRTDEEVGVWIAPTVPDTCSETDDNLDDFPYYWTPWYRTVKKGSAYFHRLEPYRTEVILLNTKEQEERPDARTFDVVMFTTDKKYRMSEIKLKKALEIINGLGTVVYRETVRAVTCDQQPAASFQQAVMTFQFEMDTKSYSGIRSMDVHPIETWMLVGCGGGKASIWNYETQETVMQIEFPAAGRVYSAVFIAREQWFAAGDGNGSIHVYSYTTAKDKVKQFQAHRHGKNVDNLAIHPTSQLLLSASSDDNYIKLWDWGNDWTCLRLFDARGVYRLIVGPRGTNTFASAVHGGVQVWDFRYSDPIGIVNYNNWDDNIREVPIFHTVNHRHFLLTSRCPSWADNSEVTIWDLRAKEELHKLIMFSSSIPSQIGSHPVLPIFAIITRPSTLLLWDTRTYRVVGMFELREKYNHHIQWIVFAGTEDLTRLVVGSLQGIDIFKINLAALLMGGGN